MYNDTHHLTIGMMESRQITTRTFFWVDARYQLMENDIMPKRLLHKSQSLLPSLFL